jgi:acyl carrier protein
MRLDPQTLLKFIDEYLGVNTADIDEGTPLFSAGIIDSAGMVELILFVESTAGVKFSPEDISLDNLDSFSRILDFVTARQAT